LTGRVAARMEADSGPSIGPVAATQGRTSVAGCATTWGRAPGEGRGPNVAGLTRTLTDRAAEAASGRTTAGRGAISAAPDRAGPTVGGRDRGTGCAAARAVMPAMRGGPDAA
jgi:hypothetical protein